MKTRFRSIQSAILLLLAAVMLLGPIPVFASSADSIGFAYTFGSSSAYSPAILLKFSNSVYVYTVGGENHSSGIIIAEMGSGSKYTANYFNSLGDFISEWLCTSSDAASDPGLLHPAYPKQGESVKIYYPDNYKTKYITANITDEYDCNGQLGIITLSENVPSYFTPCPVINSSGQCVGIWIKANQMICDWFDEKAFLSGSIAASSSGALTDPNAPVYTMRAMTTSLGTDQYSSTFWGQTMYARSQVNTITFCSSKSGAPSNAWDVSARQDRSIVAWLSGNDLYVAADGNIAPNPNASGLFSRFASLRSIDFGGCFDTSDVTNMSHMFYWCDNLCDLDVSGFNTSKVTNMTAMFAGNTKLPYLDVSSFDTSKVTGMSLMFEWCATLTSLDLSNFDTSNVTEMQFMFDRCASLCSLDISSFSTKSLQSAWNMFDYCPNLHSICCTDSRLKSNFADRQ